MEAIGDPVPWPVGDGEMARRIRAHDWAATPLGPLTSWPQNLRTAVDIMLASPAPTSILWGPERVQLYNDGYIGIAAERHPRALGRPAGDNWSEAYDLFLGPLFDRVFAGETVAIDEHAVPLQVQGGGIEDRFFTASFQPVRDEGGRVAGIFHPLVEITSKVKASAELREGEERFRGVLDGMAEGFGLVGPDFTILEHNSEALRLSGLSREEVVGRSHWEVYPGSEKSELGALLKRAMAERQPVTLEHCYAFENGRSRWLDMRAYPAPDGSLAVFWRDLTDRKRSEEALGETTRRLDAILNNTRAAVFLMDERQHCVYANAAAEKLTGYGFDDMQGRPLHDVIHHKRPDGSHYPLEECPIDRAFPARAQMSGEELFVHKDGSFYPVAFTASPVLDEDGRPIGTVIEARNIAGEKARGAELREANERLAEETRTLETLNRSGAALAGELDLERVVQMVTDAGVELTGARFGAYFHNVMDETGERLSLYTLSGADRSDFEAFGKPRPTAIFGPTFRNEGVIRSDDILVDHRYGKNAPHKGMPEGHLPVRSYLAVSVVSRSGEVLGGLLFGHPEPGRFSERHEQLMLGIAAQAAVAIDNARLFQAVQQAKETLERRVEERTAELAESERRFRGIFDSALQFMALLTPDGIVIEVNQTALNWSQIRPEDIVGRPFWDAAPMRGNPALQAAVQTGIRRAAAGETVREEHEMRGAGEVRAVVDFSLKPVPDAEGRPIWLVAEGRDITELKTAQEALRQSQKMEAMGQLTGGVAHDFNNLLTPIVGALDMLQRKGTGGERERRLIEGAAQSAERARTLVQRLLAFARRQPLQSVPVDVATLVTGMAELVASTTGPQIKVVVDAPEDLPPANADPNQLEMALLNLAVNARDAMPDGGTLRISATPDIVAGEEVSGLKPGSYIRLSVADTGTGMDEATLARAVEPFFSTKGIGRGTGLGLSMVHGLASQLGGALKIRSRPGLGTNVELWLPQSGSAPQPAERPADLAAQPHGRGTALLVDDEALVRMSTAAMLHDLGYSVVEAASAEEAMRLVDSGESFDLLVTDHLMPGMNGTELAREIRNFRPGMPVLLVSGYAEGDGIAAELPRLTKPFRKDELASSLAQLSAA